MVVMHAGMGAQAALSAAPLTIEGEVVVVSQMFEDGSEQHVVDLLLTAPQPSAATSKSAAGNAPSATVHEEEHGWVRLDLGTHATAEAHDSPMLPDGTPLVTGMRLRVTGSQLASQLSQHSRASVRAVAYSAADTTASGHLEYTAAASDNTGTPAAGNAACHQAGITACGARIKVGSADLLHGLQLAYAAGVSSAQPSLKLPPRLAGHVSAAAVKTAAAASTAQLGSTATTSTAAVYTTAVSVSDDTSSSGSTSGSDEPQEPSNMNVLTVMVNNCGGKYATTEASLRLAWYGDRSGKAPASSTPAKTLSAWFPFCSWRKVSWEPGADNRVVLVCVKLHFEQTWCLLDVRSVVHEISMLMGRMLPVIWSMHCVTFNS